MIVLLPYPDKRLSPNARCHWSKKSPVAAKARFDARAATMAASPVGMRELRAHYAIPGHIHLVIRFYPPDNRRRDLDNAIASMKSAFDGIADALGVDDSRFVPLFRMESSEGKPGSVEIEL